MQRPKKILCILLLTGSLPVQAQWQDGVAGCRVFDSEKSQSAQTILPAGPVLARPNADGGATKYLPHPLRREAGVLNITVYDCPKNKTSFGLSADFRRRLRASNWQLQYSCDGQTCGLPKGWSKALPQARGTAEMQGQNYSLAVKRNAKGSHWLALYSLDLDKRPRVVAYELRGDYQMAVTPELDFNHIKPLYETGRAPASRIYFSSGSATPSASSVAPEYENASDEKSRWIIVGHCDDQGAEGSNGLLSWRRAIAVAAKLKASGIAAESIDVFAVASFLPVSGGEGGQARQMNRRVDVFRIPLSNNASQQAALPNNEAEPTQMQ